MAVNHHVAGPSPARGANIDKGLAGGGWALVAFSDRRDGAPPPRLRGDGVRGQDDRNERRGSP